MTPELARVATGVRFHCGVNMAAQELDDDRARRRNLTCIASGLFAGGGLGTLAAALLIPTGGLVLIAVGAIVGGVASTAIAPRISAEDWDPRANPHSYVGTRSPDDDVASPS